MDKLAVIVVTYNGAQYLQKCFQTLRSVFKQSYLIVIDNASTDGTREILSKADLDYLILSDENLGFGKANNIGLQWAYTKGFQNMMLLNQDTYIPLQDAAAFLAAADVSFKKGYGVVSPVHTGPDGLSLDFKFADYVSQRNAPGLLNLIAKGVGDQEVQAVKSVNAAAWIISRNCLETVGLFDPVFPHYGEDTDYIKRMRYHGLKLGVWPYFKIVHDRPQQEAFTLEKKLARIQIWALSFLKNLERPLWKQYLHLPIHLFARINKLGKGSLWTYGKTTNGVLELLPKYQLLNRHRRQCKQKAAFLKHD